MKTEAQKRAKSKYTHERVRQIGVQFYPSEHELLDRAKQRAKDFGGMNVYIKRLIRNDLEEE